jgi:hypothetical protein
MYIMLKSLITTERKNIYGIKRIHPGEILLEEFLKPMSISAYRLAKDTGIDMPPFSLPSVELKYR